MENILVCITPQTNSERLIDKASEVAEELKGRFFVLNVQRGGSVFEGEGSAGLLEELFKYGGKKGGTVHALASENVTDTIIEFAQNNEVTRIILGEPPKLYDNGIIDSLKTRLSNVGITILEREV